MTKRRAETFLLLDFQYLLKFLFIILWHVQPEKCDLFDSLYRNTAQHDSGFFHVREKLGIVKCRVKGFSHRRHTIRGNSGRKRELFLFSPDPGH